MKHTIFVRTFAMISTLLLISFVLLGSCVAAFTWMFNTSDRQATVRVSAERMQAVVKSVTIDRTIMAGDLIQRSLELASDLSGFHIVVTNSTGRVIATSDGVTASAGLYVGSTIIAEIAEKGEYAGSGKLGGLYSALYYSVGLPVMGAGALEPAGYVFVSAHTESMRQMIVQFARVFTFVAAGILLLCCVWAYFYTKRMTLPIKTVAAASREFARGNLRVRVPENARDSETRELAISFNSMAESLEKTEEKRSEFIANISHELKTPMTSITGYVDGILDGIITGEKMEHYLNIVSSETKRLSRLVSSMLELSRIESNSTALGEMRVFDLCELVRQVLVGQETKITDKKLEVVLELDESIEVRADRDAITRVIYNLVDNAVKYSDEGTPILLSVRRKGDRALFAITDTGKPIPPDERKQIFERFHKTDRSRSSEGLGLGLYLVKSILAQHGEDVWCEGEGRVTTMYFTLPLVRKQKGEG